jgi:tagaturonate reductase
VLEFYYEHRDSSPETLVHTVLANEKMWGQDLTQIAGLEPAVASGLKLIREQGAEAAYASCL